MILADPARIDAYTRAGWWGLRTLDDEFRDAVARHPAREAVVDPPNRELLTDGAPRRLDWATLAHEVGRMAAVLHGLDLRRDDVVAVQLVNSVEQYVVYLACLRLGLIVTPLPVQYREHELRHVLALTGARAVVTATRLGRHAAADRRTGLAAEFGCLAHRLVYGAAVPTGSLDLARALAQVREADVAIAEQASRSRAPSANDIATLCWTSGTEAVPKAVPRSHNEWLIVSHSIIEAAELAPGCRLLNPFPLVNMAGWSTCIAAWLRLGATVVQHHPFDLGVFLAQLREERIDYTVAPPAILTQLLKNDALLAGIDFARLRRIGSGAAPLSPWLVSGWAERHGVQIVNCFGSNEGAALTGSPRDIPDPALRALFFPRAGVDGYEWSVSTARKIRTRLVDPETGATITEPGRTGELQVAGPTIFAGYYRAPELTARAFDDEGFYRSGDLFEIAGPRGEYYKFVGRRKDLVVRGGMNISAEEIEGLLLAHPAVREAAVVGYPDEVLGERVCAVLVLKDGVRLELGELNRHLLEVERIAAYKQPERLLVVDALPRNPVGKVLKRVLRDRLRDGAHAAGSAAPFDPGSR